MKNHIENGYDLLINDTVDIFLLSCLYNLKFNFLNVLIFKIFNLSL